MHYFIMLVSVSLRVQHFFHSFVLYDITTTVLNCSWCINNILRTQQFPLLIMHNLASNNTKFVALCVKSHKQYSLMSAHIRKRLLKSNLQPIC